MGRQHFIGGVFFLCGHRDCVCRRYCALHADALCARAKAERVCLCDIPRLLVEIDPTTLPPAPDGTPATEDFLDGAILPCAISSIVWSTVYAYDDSKFPGAKPSSIADFFDTKKFPGKRGLRKNPKPNLEFALIADGVPVAIPTSDRDGSPTDNSTPVTVTNASITDADFGFQPSGSVSGSDTCESGRACHCWNGTFGKWQTPVPGSTPNPGCR